MCTLVRLPLERNRHNASANAAQCLFYEVRRPRLQRGALMSGALAPDQPGKGNRRPGQFKAQSGQIEVDRQRKRQQART